MANERAKLVERLAKHHDGFEATRERLGGLARFESVYGEPLEKHGRVVIPAAEITATLGFGFGMGSEPKGKDDAFGGGGGTGGSVTARPVATIVMDKDGVRVEPVVDVTKIALAGAALLGGMMWMLRSRRKEKK